MSQTIWYFDAPTIRWCVVHETTAFAYDVSSGLRCRGASGSDKTCNERCWLDFALEPDDERDAEALDRDMNSVEVAEDYGERLNTIAYCELCDDERHATELDAKGRCIDNEDCLDEDEEDELLDEDEEDDLWDEQSCTICHCTDSRACPGSCCWETSEVCCAHSRGAAPCPRCGSQTPPWDELSTVYAIYQINGTTGVLNYMLKEHPGAHQRYCVPCEKIYPILHGACSVCRTKTEPSPHGYTDDIAGEPKLDENGEVIHRPTTCGTCNRTWNDAIITGCTPVPSGRCPFEYEHGEPC